MRYDYHLVIQFDSENSEKLYDGISWYNKKVIDEILIAKDKIDILFRRSTEINEVYMYSPQCPVRYEMYRAVCFYLSVVGYLPEVKGIYLTTPKEEIPLDVLRLTRHWENCRIQITMDASVAAKCFQQDGKGAYTVLTHFLKAQLGTFSDGNFRVAWSGLNAIYTDFAVDGREPDKLKLLKSRITELKMDNVLVYVGELPDTFWKELEWYNYLIHGLKVASIEKEVDKIGTVYKDKTVFEMLTKYLRGLNKKRKEMPPEVLQKKIEKQLNSRKKKIFREEALFLVDYCYMLRNRSVHAGRPYPVFGLFENEEGTKDHLKNFLLYTIIDLMTETK